jgi:predicted dehydrogenase
MKGTPLAQRVPGVVTKRARRTSKSERGPLRMAVIGVGHLGRHHARILAALPGVHLVAVVDIDRARAEASAAGARVTTDYREVWDDVDAVTIAVPTVAHLDVARLFLERGVHVLVEKPMASSLAEADAMVTLADTHGAVLAVGHSERFNPAIAAAWPLITTPRFIEVHRLSAFPERSLDIDVVFDVMIHDLDIISSVDRSGIVSVEAVGIPVLSSRIDIANARVKFASGCVANLTASRISREQVRKVRFFQPDSYISIDYAASEVEAWRLVPRPGARPAIEGGPVAVGREEPLVREMTDFVEAIRDRRAPTVSGRDGRRALALATRVAEAIAETARP